MRASLLVAAVTATASLAAAAEAPSPLPIWGSGSGLDAGRSFQSASLLGPRGGHLAQVWNWSLPERWPATQWYAPAIDADGVIFYFSHYMQPTVFAIDGDTGKQLWKSELVQPYWRGYDGFDPLLVGASAVLIAIPTVVSYNANNGAYFCGLSRKTGELVWNVTLDNVAVQSAVLSDDGGSAYIHLYNATLLIVDVDSGEVASRIPLADVDPKTTYRMTVAQGVALPGAAGKGGGATTDVLILTNATALTAFDVAGDGTPLWELNDPTGANMSFGYGAGIPLPSTTTGTRDGTVYVTTGANYGSPSGSAAIDAACGAVVWLTQKWPPALPSNVISAARYPTRQGDLLASVFTGTSYPAVVSISQSNGSFTGMGYLPRWPRGGLSWTSNVAVDADGVCGYLTGQGKTCDTCVDDAYVVGFCADGGGYGISITYTEMQDAMCVPDTRRVAIGPRDGQITVWHHWGVIVYEGGAAGPPESPRYTALCR